MVKSSFYTIALMMTLLFSNKATHTVAPLTPEQELIKHAIDQAPINAYEFLEILKKHSAEAQNVIINVLYEFVTPHQNITQEEAMALQKNIFDLVNSSSETQDICKELIQKTQAQLSPYLNYLEQVFEVARSSSESESDVLEVQKILMEKLGGLEHMINGMYYDAAYSYFKEVNPQVLVVMLDNLGQVIPEAERTNTLPSIQEIQTLIVNLRRQSAVTEDGQKI